MSGLLMLAEEAVKLLAGKQSDDDDEGYVSPDKEDSDYEEEDVPSEDEEEEYAPSEGVDSDDEGDDYESDDGDDLVRRPAKENKGSGNGLLNALGLRWSTREVKPRKFFGANGEFEVPPSQWSSKKAAEDAGRRRARSTDGKVGKRK